MEYWIEENIRPNTRNDMDRVLFEHIKPIIFFLRSKGWIFTWHFLRESRNWRGRGNTPPHISHIRLRVRAKSVINIRRARIWLRKVLDGLQQMGKISDHYSGKHGTPNRYYRGEKRNFNQRGRILHRNGWNVIQKWLESGSEIELTFLESRFQGIRLGTRFVMKDILHFFANQRGRNEGTFRYRNQSYFAIQM